MASFEELCDHVSKTRIASIYNRTYPNGTVYAARLRLGNGIIKENVDHVRKLIDMIDALSTDGSAPVIAISYYVNHHFSPSGWTGCVRDDRGVWTPFDDRAERGTDFDLVDDYVHNLQQKRTTLFWELLTRVDQK